MIGRAGRSPLGACLRSPLGVLRRSAEETAFYRWLVEAEVTAIFAEQPQNVDGQTTGRGVEGNPGAFTEFDPPVPFSEPMTVSTSSVGQSVDVPSGARVFHQYQSQQMSGVFHIFNVTANGNVSLVEDDAAITVPEVGEWQFLGQPIAPNVNQHSIEVRLPPVQSGSDLPDSFSVDRSYSGSFAYTEVGRIIDTNSLVFFVADIFLLNPSYSATVRFTFTPVSI